VPLSSFPPGKMKAAPKTQQRSLLIKEFDGFEKNKLANSRQNGHGDVNGAK
jgi:hypothetical protein